MQKLLFFFWLAAISHSMPAQSLPNDILLAEPEDHADLTAFPLFGRDCPRSTEPEDCSVRAFLEYVYLQIQYPAQARTKGAEGQVVIAWTVDAQGHLQDPEILEDPGLGMGDEVLRIFRRMQKKQGKKNRWQPGEVDGRPVDIRLKMPLNFRLA